MKSKIEQFAKNNNLEVAQVYFLLVPVVVFILVLVAIAVAFNVMYSIVGVIALIVFYMSMEFLKSLKDSFKGLVELALTKPASQN